MAVRVRRATVELQEGILSLDMKRVEAPSGLVEFSLNLRLCSGIVWVPVIRYDNCHGGCHVHRFWLPRDRQVRPWPDPAPATVEAAFEDARVDLSLHWPSYLSSMVGKIRQHSNALAANGGP